MRNRLPNPGRPKSDMPYFSCESCDQMIELAVFDQTVRQEYCPVCEKSTVWTTEFEGEGDVYL